MTSVFLAYDHAGTDLVPQLTLPDGFQWISVPTDPLDYPLSAATLSERFRAEAETAFGVLICGSGMGMAIAANRYPWVRATVCTTPLEAELAREHNQANVLCLSARLTASWLAQRILETFLSTSPSPEERHHRRVGMLGKVGPSFQL